MKKQVIAATTGAVLGMALLHGTASAATYQVQSGDSLWKLSTAYKTSVAQLKSLNGLKSDVLYPGQLLQVPDLTKATPVAVSKPVQVTYTVVSGDTLSKIAAKFGLTYKQLMTLNKLSSTVIYPGQKLVVKEIANNGSTTVKPGTPTAPAASKPGTPTAPAASKPIKPQTQPGTKPTTTATPQAPSTAKPATPQAPSTAKPATPTNSPAQPTAGNEAQGKYAVQAGDSLWLIARNTNMTIAELKELNGLTSDVVRVGQLLKITKTAPDLKKDSDTAEVFGPATINVTQLATDGQALNGTPYKWAGNTPEGFDCSGFIFYVINKQTYMPRLSTAGYWNAMTRVQTPAIGDFVFFETYQSGPSHMGIYLGNNKFIHAGTSTGVTISDLTYTYWSSKYLGAKRLIK